MNRSCILALTFTSKSCSSAAELRSPATSNSSQHATMAFHSASSAVVAIQRSEAGPIECDMRSAEHIFSTLVCVSGSIFRQPLVYLIAFTSRIAALVARLPADMPRSACRAEIFLVIAGDAVDHGLSYLSPTGFQLLSRCAQSCRMADSLSMTGPTANENERPEASTMNHDCRNSGTR